MAIKRRPTQRESDDFPGFADVAPIGVGGFASVYRATELETGRVVALKVVNVGHASQHVLDQWRRETIALGALSAHPNIVTLYRTMTMPDGRPLLVLELCNGSVQDRFRQHGSIEIRSVVSLGIKIAGALETAHRAGILHRDVKPTNLLLTQFGEPALADFGVARLQTSSEASAAAIGFTTLHAAPELLEGGGASAATDVYELASTMYALAAGKAAFRAFDDEAPASVILRIIRDPVEPILVAGIPLHFSDLLVQAMAKDPAERPASALEFAHRLQAIEHECGWASTQFVIPNIVMPLPPAEPATVTPPPHADPVTTTPGAHDAPDALAGVSVTPLGTLGMGSPIIEPFRGVERAQGWDPAGADAAPIPAREPVEPAAVALPPLRTEAPAEEPVPALPRVEMGVVSPSTVRDGRAPLEPEPQTPAEPETLLPVPPAPETAPPLAGVPDHDTPAPAVAAELAVPVQSLETADEASGAAPEPILAQPDGTVEPSPPDGVAPPPILPPPTLVSARIGTPRQIPTPPFAKGPAVGERIVHAGPGLGDGVPEPLHPPHPQPGLEPVAVAGPVPLDEGLPPLEPPGDVAPAGDDAGAWSTRAHPIGEAPPPRQRGAGDDEPVISPSFFLRPPTDDRGTPPPVRANAPEPPVSGYSAFGADDPFPVSHNPEFGFRSPLEVTVMRPGAEEEPETAAPSERARSRLRRRKKED